MVYKNFQKHGLGQIRISWKNIYPWRLVRSLLTWTLPRTAQRVIPWLCTLEWPPPGWTWTPMVLWPSSCGSSSPGVTTDWPGTRITIKRSRCSGKNMSFYFLQTSITSVCILSSIFRDHVLKNMCLSRARHDLSIDWIGGFGSLPDYLENTRSSWLGTLISVFWFIMT